MMRGRIASLAALAVLVGLAGCRGVQPPATAPAMRCVVSLHGCGHAGTQLTLTADRRTLRDALAGVAVDPVVNAGGYPVLVFAHLTKPDAEYYVPAELIEETALGDILLDPGEKIELVPWTATDMFRGLKEVAPPLVTPAPVYVNDLAPFLKWYLTLPRDTPLSLAARKRLEREKDQIELAIRLGQLVKGMTEPTRLDELPHWSVDFAARATAEATRQRPKLVFPTDLPFLHQLYAERIRAGKPFNLTARGYNSRGEQHPNANLLRVDVEVLNDIQAGRDLPRVKSFEELSGRDRDKDLVVLERTAEGRPAVFVLPPFNPTKPNEQKADPNKPLIHDVLEAALVFDGDTITITSPDRVPLVEASQAVARQLLRPAASTQRAFNRGGR